MELLSSWPILLIHDPDILNLKDTYLAGHDLDLEAINLVKRIQTKISIQESSSNWKSKLYLYSPQFTGSLPKTMPSPTRTRISSGK